MTRTKQKNVFTFLVIICICLEIVLLYTHTTLLYFIFLMLINIYHSRELQLLFYILVITSLLPFSNLSIIYTLPINTWLYIKRKIVRNSGRKNESKTFEAAMDVLRLTKKNLISYFSFTTT